MRARCLPLVFSFVALFASSPPASAGEGENGRSPRFFSPEKLLDTYSAYRVYLDTSEEGTGPARDERSRMQSEIMRLLIEPGRISETMLADLFRIGRRFARESSSRVPDYEVEEVYDREDMRKLGLGERQTALLKELIKSQLYLDDPGNFAQARRDLDLAVIRRQSEAAEREKPIPVEDLSVKNPDAGACLASTRAGECLVSVGEFNAYLPYADAQIGRTVAEARQQLLRFYAFQKLKSLEGRKEATGADKQNIIEHVRDVQEYRRIRESLIGMGLPVTDAASLQEAYQKHYREHFAERDSVLFQVLASSDSVYLDSIHRFLGRQAEKRSVPGPKSAPTGDSAVPWITFAEKDLPAALLAPTDSFRVGQYSGPIRTPSGFFIVKLLKVIPIPATPPEKAQAMCMYLATRDKYANLDSVLEAKAGKYYQAHPEEFLTPDTASYRFWLVPGARYRTAREYAADTARIRPMDKRGTDLPRAFTKKLNAKPIPDSLRLRLVDTEYGQMLVKLLALKKGGIKIPFALARKGIVEKSMQAAALPPAPPLAPHPADSAVSREVLFTLGSGDRVFSAIMDETRRISESEIEAAIAAGKIDPPAQDPQRDERFYESARKRMEFARIEKKHAEFQDQLGDIVFHTGLLSAR